MTELYEEKKIVATVFVTPCVLEDPFSSLRLYFKMKKESTKQQIEKKMTSLEIQHSYQSSSWHDNLFPRSIVE